MSGERNLAEPEILDLTKEAQVPPGLAKIPTIPFDERRFREYSRIGLAGSLVACIIMIILGLFWAFLSGRQVHDIKDVGEMLFTPIVGLVGAVVGFYFGVERT
ncbi:MAG TPA: hypothetical protein VFL62_08775 [Bradyrhizobium sp.]|uniref:hypothetical protein n=1 Tax=Bradyrhizobium sp. TaxID=376 RepID=UPI002D7FE1B8|nr:hypothetical protein [Bradyrhizobium sp.]HET7886304.1 hypothetical protein [Bradyrhizobium sp.]